MLQEQVPPKSLQIPQDSQMYTHQNMKSGKSLRESQLDFQKNYPKNIFIPMIEYLAELGLQEDYEQCVGSREEFQGKNVVSLGLIHKLMGASWFKQNVEKRVLVSNISNKILMNSKIKKKLFHIYIVKNLFQTYDEDLKEFKKRISKLANSISQQSYVDDEMFEFPSAILYLLRLFFKIISANNKSLSQIPETHHNSHFLSDVRYSKQAIAVEKSVSHHSQKDSEEQITTRQGSKEEYKYYIRKIINCFNKKLPIQGFTELYYDVEKALIERQKEIVAKYSLPPHVPGWGSFLQKVVKKCFECFEKGIKITHAMMNQWISGFKLQVTNSKFYFLLRQKEDNIDEEANKEERKIPYQFHPLILKISEHQKAN